MSVRLVVRIKKGLADAVKARAKAIQSNFTRVTVQALNTWLREHESETTGTPDDVRPRRGDSTNANMDVNATLKARIDAEVARRQACVPKLFPCSNVDLVEEALREWLAADKEKTGP